MKSCNPKYAEQIPDVVWHATGARPVRLIPIPTVPDTIVYEAQLPVGAVIFKAIDYMFEPLEARLVYGECASSNRASARVMEKCGLTLVAQWNEPDATTGTGETHQRYAIGVGEWRQQRSASGPRS
jgi:hypothetical protein